MKNTTFSLLAIIPFLFGCASTTIKTYSTDFKVSPAETKDVGKTVTASDGTQFIVKQQYKFDATVTETIQSPNGERDSRVIASPSVTTLIGNEAIIRVGEGFSRGEAIKNGTQLEVKFEDLGTQYKAYLKATIQKGGEEPVSCSQTITIQK